MFINTMRKIIYNEKQKTYKPEHELETDNSDNSQVSSIFRRDTRKDMADKIYSTTFYLQLSISSEWVSRGSNSLLKLVTLFY